MTAANRTRPPLAALLTVTLIGTLAAPVQAANADQRAVTKARNYLDARDVGRAVMTALHLGSDYVGHTYSSGKSFGDGTFDLTYRYRWYSSEEGLTDVVFHCDAYGNVIGLDAPWSNAGLNQPFAFADVATWAVGSALAKMVIDWLGDKITDDDRKWIRSFSKNPDSKKALAILLWTGWSPVLLKLRGDNHDR